jgi:hypothetical protein
MSRTNFLPLRSATGPDLADHIPAPFALNLFRKPKRHNPLLAHRSLIVKSIG